MVMRRCVFAVVPFLFTFVLYGSAYLGAGRPAQEPSFPGAPSVDTSQQRALLDQYCVTCHNQRTQTAGLMFDTMDLARLPEDARIWEGTIRKLRGRMMPPPNARQPDPAVLTSFIAWLESSLDEAAAANPRPGSVALHRLNRAEYANAIEELLGLRVDAGSLLPEDDISEGFDNIASVLKVSPAFIDQYVSAARLVSVQAIGNPAPRPESVTLRPPPGVDQSMYVEGLPLGTRGGFMVEHLFAADGEYEFTINGLASAGYAQGMEYEHTVILTIDGVKVFENHVGGEEDLRAVDQEQAAAVAAIRSRFERVRIPVTAGIHKVGVTFVARSMAESDDTLHSFVPSRGVGRIPRVATVDVVGPFNPAGITGTPSRTKIFVCRPEPSSTEDEELSCAAEILSNIARPAFRRPISERDLAAPLAFFKDGRAGGDFDSGIQNGLMAILASPKFLYRAEPVPPDLPPGSIYAIGDLELASRLSFFLWSQMPDDELLNLAVEEKLRDPVVLEQQVRRMLADPRSRSLVTNFAFQWLQMRGLGAVSPDAVLFPNFDNGLLSAFLREMELFVQSIIDEDRSVVELLTSDHTFVNERLALHYGIPNVRGDRFRRVTLDDPNRWGLLGKGGILMVTSYPDRTAPVLRGAWILENILGTPPAPPLPDVEGLIENVEGARILTVRERTELHRANPACNSCHGVMDPLGFALENFDAIGEWRTIDRWAGTPIDASGQLADGSPVNSPGDLRLALAKDPEQFVQTLTEKLLMYSLGRNVEYHDMPAVRKIVRDAARDDYRFSSIVMGIVSSAPFRMKHISDSGDAVALLQ